MAERRVIAHLDADAFFATCHELRDPSLKGRAVIVGGDGPRSIVTTASYPARKFGVGSAMPMSQARRLCPHAVFIAPDRELYTSTSRAVWDLVADHLVAAGAVYDTDDGPIAHLERAGIDEAYAELVAVERPVRVLRDLISDVRDTTGIQLSTGLSPSRVVSKIASDLEKPASFVVLSREQALERLADRPLSIVPGIGPKSAQALAAMGYRTLADLRTAPEAQLVDQFGESRGRWLAAVGGLSVDEPVVPVRQRKSISSEHTFPSDIDPYDEHSSGALVELASHVERMSREVADSAARRSFRGRNVAIKVRTGDWTTFTRAETLPDYTADPDEVAQVALRLWEQHMPPKPIRLLGVRLGSFEHVERAGDGDDPQLRLPID